MFQFTKIDSIRSQAEGELLNDARVADAKFIWDKYHNEFKRRACPICANENGIMLDAFHGTFPVELCSRCNTPFVNPAPSASSLSDFYENGECNRILNALYQKRASKQGSFVLDSRVSALFSIISRFPEGAELNLLEVGCNQGTFLSQVRESLRSQFPERKVNLYGIDLSKNAIDMNKDREIRLIHASAESLAGRVEWKGFFDIVCHFELIEHIVDPASFMLSLHDLMKETSYMLLTTPNLEGLEIVASHYNDYRLLAHAIVPPLHINAFSTLNFTYFALRFGFSIVSLETPGKLDVDCVSKYADKCKDLEEVFKRIASLDDETKGWLQAFVSRLKVSSTLRAILAKP